MHARAWLEGGPHLAGCGKDPGAIEQGPGSVRRQRLARENIYGKMQVSESAPKPKGNAPTQSAPWWQRTRGITPALLLLILALATSLLAVTLLYSQGRSRLQAVEEAARNLRVSLQPTNTSAAPARESDTLQLLGEVQVGVRMLRARLGNFSAENRELQTRLDTVAGARGAGSDSCRDVWTKASAGWRCHGGNLYYFSQEEKSWDEAEQFCVSQGSHLTSVSSQKEQEFLSKEIQGKNHWIGLTDLGTEGRWRWVDGSEYRADASRGFWDSHQPDNWHQGIGGREDCVEIRTKKQAMWNDANCSLPARWICKQARGQAGL
ncbi:C-type lectin domain family 10 member A-like [Pelodiscus sinensis]|uniref:C-type lectin domain family 10 member A-like n=1 Tax=Pelodiscus sinensis TaxID=13735 RepID=UPI003F6B2522